MGNPPFMGVAFITEQLGEGYVAWLQMVHPGTVGKFDLSAHFFRRAASLLGRHGAMGFIATNTISQGDTRHTGLQPLLRDGWILFDATNSMPWPGAAAVTVSVVHAAIGQPARQTPPVLDGQTTGLINSRLRPRPERADAAQLLSNAGCAYQGSIVLGMGFTLTPEVRDEVVAADPLNAQRIFPYLGGQEVNTSPTQDHDRFVIDLGDRSLEECSSWPGLVRHLEIHAKPERERGRSTQDYPWWRFWRGRAELYAALSPLKRCLVNSQVSKHLVFAHQPTDRVFAHTLYAYPLPDQTAFAILQSRVHEAWARLLSSSMKSDLRYTASDCFETFPFPEPDPRAVIPPLELAGEQLYEARAQFMRETDQGLTKTYNALKDTENDDPAVLHLRQLHEQMDRAVLDAYGWQDIAVPPYCPKSPEDERALEAFNDEVIDRLYALNEVRAREERRLGLGKAGKGGAGGANGAAKPAAKGKGKKATSQGGLFE